MPSVTEPAVSTPTGPATPVPAAPRMSFRSLLTRDRWVEIARILAVAAVILLYDRGLVGRPVLLAAVAFGLYPLVKTGVLDLVRERSAACWSESATAVRRRLVRCRTHAVAGMTGGAPPSPLFPRTAHVRDPH